MPIPERRRSVIDPFQPGTERSERAMPYEVDLQRRHGDTPLGNCVAVGTRPRFLLRARGTDPVHRAAAWILGSHHGRRAMAIAETAGTEAPQLPGRHVWHVDVED